MAQNIVTVFSAVLGAYERLGLFEEFANHVEPVTTFAHRTFGAREGVVALCHDLLEDEIMTVDEVVAMGVDEEQLEALHLLTHDKSKQSYNDYIFSLQASEIAVKVKLCDAMNNFERCIKDGNFKRAMKYSRVIDLMTEAIANKHWEK